MELVAQQQARKVAQLHRTIATRANMLETHTTLQEVQWRGMKSWLRGKDKKRDTYQQDDPLWGEGIKDMVAGAVAATERGENEDRRADTEVIGLEALIHPDGLTQTGGLEKAEEGQQPQLGRQLKSMPTPKPKPKPNPNRSPKPNPAPAPTPGPAPTPTPRATYAPRRATTSAPTPTATKRCETVPPRNRKNATSPGPAPTTGSSMAD